MEYDSPDTASSHADEQRRGRGVRRLLRNVAITVGLTLVLLVLLEGASSALLLAWRLGTAAEQRTGVDWRHTRYDEELGWAHQPNIEIEDLYGPGLGFSINAQGFRGKDAYEIDEPPGKVRVICSGDSFTLGYGVADADSWCAQLSSIDPRLETVNMGQVAYGVGQAYLWYMRDGRPLDHSVHVLGVISVDFERMMSDDFLGVAKPRLAVVDDSLVVKNVPVRRPAGRLTRAAREQVGELRLVQAARALMRRLPALGSPEDGIARDSASLPDSASQEVAARILESLAAVNDAKKSTLVLAYIPVRNDVRAGKASDRAAGWLQFLEAEARTRGFLLIDLVDEFARRSPDEFARMYIPKQAGIGRGHLSAYGNGVVAEAIYKRLTSVPELSGRLEPPALTN